MIGMMAPWLKQQQQRRLPHGVILNRRGTTGNSSNGGGAMGGHHHRLVSTILVCSLIGMIVVYVVVLWNFYPVSYNLYDVFGVSGDVSGGSDGVNNEVKVKQQKEAPMILQGKDDYCQFRSYPEHRYYGIPKFHGTSSSTPPQLPHFLDSDYIYGQLPQMIQPSTSVPSSQQATTRSHKSHPTTQKLCVDQSEWYKPEPIQDIGGSKASSSSLSSSSSTPKTTLPFADGTNPSILKLKDNPRIKESIRKIFEKFNNDPSITAADNTPMYLTTICMTNSQCGWNDTPQQLVEYRISQRAKPSTVRTVLLVLNANFDTLLEATIYTELNSAFGRKIKEPQFVADNKFKQRAYALDDARLFTYKGDIWISYREGKAFGYDKQVLNRVHLELLESSSSSSMDNNSATSSSSSSKQSLTVTLKASETETLCCGRNMALMDNVHTDQLQALTWVDPITVVDVEFTKPINQRLQQNQNQQQSEQQSNNKDNEAQQNTDGKQRRRRLLDDNNKSEKKKSHFHGTNGFMLYMPHLDEYLGIGHFHRPPDREANIYARFGHHYTHAFFTIPSRPPYHLKRLSPEIVLPSHAISNDAEVIQFWSGLELYDDNTITLAYGINDCEGAATYLDLSTIESLLRPVPQGKEVVDLMMPLGTTK